MHFLFGLKYRVNDDFRGQSSRIIALVPAVNLRHDKPTYQEYGSVNGPSDTIDAVGMEQTTSARYIVHYSPWSCSPGRARDAE